MTKVLLMSEVKQMKFFPDDAQAIHDNSDITYCIILTLKHCCGHNCRKPKINMVQDLDI